VNDDGVIDRAPLGRKDLAHRRRILRIGAEPVNGFGGKCNELAVAQCLHGSLDFDLGSSDNSNHGCEFYQPHVRGYVYLGVQPMTAIASSNNVKGAEPSALLAAIT
jgi:hypothetical protein